VRTVIETTPGITNQDFTKWFASMDVPERYPENIGFGILQPVTPEELPGFIASSTADSPVTPAKPFSLNPPGTRDLYCLGRVGASPSKLSPVFEPGFDLCSVPAYSAALWLAADSGQAVVLRVSPNTFGMILPVYRGGVLPAATANRRSALIAWTGGIFDATGLLDIAAQGQSGVSVELSRRNPHSAETPIAKTANIESSHRLEHTVTQEVDGVWVIRVSAPASYGALSPTLQGATLLLVGIAFSLLLFLLVLVLAGSRSRALVLVDQKTRELQHQALHDGLTGLPNRALILDRLEQALARSRRQHSAVSAMFVDLDNFKDVNDTFGHAAGDELLRELASRLSSVVRGSDTVGRLGGDEFVVLAEGSSLDAGPEVLAERLLDVLREPFLIGGNEGAPFSMSGSVGVANGDRPTAGDLLRDADVALYQAKALGKNRFVVFQPSMQTAVQDRLALEFDLRRAIEDKQLFLVYQPTFDLQHATVTGVEALLRWRHPQRGVLQPDAFLPLAEDTGLIVEIDRWVLREATRQTQAWQTEGRHLNVWVKISARQLESDDLLAEVGDALVQSGLDPASLTLEVTEATIMRCATAAASHLAALKTLGIRLAIDDFGSGYSSLANLQRFPVDVLKINRPFISSVAASSEAAALVDALVDLGQILGMEAVPNGNGESDLGERSSVGAGTDDHGFGSDWAPEAAAPFMAEAIPRFLATWNASPGPTGV
jgi:diguanylate cyclase (GGDEF)-like protein